MGGPDKGLNVNLTIVGPTYSSFELSGILTINKEILPASFFHTRILID